MGIRDVPRQELIERTAKKLAELESIKAPDWATFVKTGVFKERPPTRTDWWQVRAASILAKLAEHSPVGVQKLRTWYGGKKNRGVQPEKFFRASGSILRKILQQLEKAGFAKKIEKGLHKGRAITPQGVSFLDKIASEMMKEMNIINPKKPEGELDIPDEKPKKKKPKKAVKKRAPRKIKKAVKKTIEPAEKPSEQKPEETAEKEVKKEEKKAEPEKKEEPKKEEKPSNEETK